MSVSCVARFRAFGLLISSAVFRLLHVDHDWLLVLSHVCPEEEALEKLLTYARQSRFATSNHQQDGHQQQAADQPDVRVVGWIETHFSFCFELEEYVRST